MSQPTLSEPSRAVRQLVPVLALSLLIGVASGSASAQTAGFRLDIANPVVAPGDPIEIEVILENPGAQPIGGGQCALTFDTALFSLASLTPGDVISGAATFDFFDWNGPPPVGAGGALGCPMFWDGADLDAVVAVFTFDGAGFTGTETPVLRFTLEAEAGVGNEATVIDHALPDLTCLWSGTVLTDPTGLVVPTSQAPAPVQVSDVAPPAALSCGSAGGEVALSWMNPEFYEAIVVRRDGIIIADLTTPMPDPPANSYSDTAVVPGATHDYAVSGVLGGIESPAALCTVTVTIGISAPGDFTCIDAGGSAALTWTNSPFGYDDVEVLRDGALLATLPGTTESYDDLTAPSGVSLEYEVRGVLGGSPGDGALCTVTVALPAESFIRGDASQDGVLDLADAIVALDFLFQEGPLACEDAADSNDDGMLNIADPIYLLGYQFSGGPAPLAPFPDPGPDPTDTDGLGCGGP